MLSLLEADEAAAAAAAAAADVEVTEAEVVVVDDSVVVSVLVAEVMSVGEATLELDNSSSVLRLHVVE